MSSTRRANILLHAARLFSKRGVARTTVRDIAEEVGILPGSLYHYFESKEAIVCEIVVAFVDDLNERYKNAVVPGETSRERLDRMVAVSFEAAKDHPFATEIYHNERALSSAPADSRIATTVRVANSYWADAIARGVEAGEFRTDVDPFHFHQLLRESVWFTVRFHRATLMEKSAQYQQNLIAIFLDGFTLGPAESSEADPAEPSEADPAQAAPADLRTVNHAVLTDLQRDVQELKEMVRELRSSRD